MKKILGLFNVFVVTLLLLTMPIKASATNRNLNGNIKAKPNASKQIYKELDIPPEWISTLLVKKDAYANANYSENLINELKNKTVGLVFSKVSGPIWLIVNADGSISGKPEISDLGSNSFIIQVEDGVNLAVTTKIIVNVINSNHSKTVAELEKFVTVANTTEYGKTNPFSSELKNIYEQTLLAEDDLDIGDYDKSLARITPILASYPIAINANSKWSNFSNYSSRYFKNFNGNTPNGYVHLNSINEIIKTYKQAKTNPSKILTLTVVLVKFASYPKPDGSGNEIVEIDQRIRENNYEKIKIQFNLLSHYIYALTNGEAKLHVQIVETDYTQQYVYNAITKKITSSGYTFGINSINSNLLKGSDILCEILPWKPKDAIFNTIDIQVIGGMGGYFGNKLNRGVFIPWSSDYFLEPGYIKSRFYGPEWAQHEFFHHIYNIFSEFEFEKESHQWYTRSKWPTSFVGTFEGDYYQQSIDKKIKDATTSAYARLNQGLIENEPPTWINSQINVKEANVQSSYLESISSYAADKDNNQLVFKKISGPSWLKISSTGQLSGSPTVDDLGLNVFKVSVDDNYSVAIQTFININVSLSSSPLSNTKVTNDFTNEGNGLNTVINIIPNPVDDFLTLSEIDQIEKIAIYNLEGKLLIDEILISKQLDVYSLKSGMYVLNITFKNGSESRIKFLKK